ncbi:GvpL/GvpF family gas vesicle protein [Nonomuraea turkmeniaca]|uniref:GvpL/GvpF family gas vesicle protein n=1 Tax=Nonomuraea turkmeniaca TaxID=103838 RepID=A0A5S4FSX0_9ACTN|nr:GvpL/GvpF family gas vesicle protein [Nonomuraea turkmeniaca]TMR23867.1 GvpL/GvpF family gas vesicle protein [Nonomuraea turkmeniaca]
MGTGVYVYGLVPEDVEVSGDARGVGDEPGEIKVVRHREIGALVSEVPLDRPLDTADDLLRHQGLLDATAAEVPVLPLRFGAVLADMDAVVDELLAPHHDDFLAALKEMEGRAEYVVKGRYVEQAVPREVIEAARKADTRTLLDALTPVSVLSAVRKPSAEPDAVHLALLVERDRQDELEEVVAEFADRWAGRVEFRLLGPMAAYDFVMGARRGGDEWD